MLEPDPDTTVVCFREPKRSLGDLDADTAALMIASASDIALLLDPQGVILDVALGNDNPALRLAQTWTGRKWSDTVTVESQSKVGDLLAEAVANRSARWREINHPQDGDAEDIPIRYSAFRMRDGGPIVALGRDLRDTAMLQQRLVEAQLSMEREYTRMRNAETRYRLLFQLTSEAVLILDGSSLRVTEANPAALAILEKPLRRVIERGFLDMFPAEASRTIQDLLSRAQDVGKVGPVRVEMSPATNRLEMSASVFRQHGTMHYLVFLASVGVAGETVDAASKSRFGEVVANAPDGFVLIDENQRILSVNTAFLDMIQVAREDQVTGHFLGRWLGRSDFDLNLITTNLRELGSVRMLATTVRSEFGGFEEVEISGVSVPNGDPPCFGLILRSVTRERQAPAAVQSPMPHSVEQLTELVGRVPLKKLVQESTDVIEQLCIEAALKLTGDNRASAAEMLGLSRQSLYVKLRRFGIGDDDPDERG